MRSWARCRFRARSASPPTGPAASGRTSASRAPESTAGTCSSAPRTPLYQDGPAATTAGGSPARILRYDLRRNRLERQWIYVTDPVAEPPVPATAFSVNGLVELLPLDDDHLIAMERSFSVGAPGTGNTIKLYLVSLRGHTASKTLLLDLDELGIPLDNVEGMTFGPRLRGGRRSVVLVSDNNFAASQFTQFLLFALQRPS